MPDPPDPASPAAQSLVRCRPARREEIPIALRLILASDGRPADDARVDDFLRAAPQRRIDPSALWLAEQRGRLLWAVLPMVSPGRTMLLLAPPQLPAGDTAPAAGMLVDAVCRRAALSDVQLAQALLDPADLSERRLYAEHGFREMAELIYLQSTVRRRAAVPTLPRGFTWLNYSPATHDAFARTIAESYHGSLDCPGLNGLREMEDVIAGHKASGEFDPALWFLLVESTRDAPDGVPARGVLLLSRLARSDVVELVYFGLTPEARGRGLGDVAMRHAFAVVAARGHARVSLAVDAANGPALNLYYRHGMQRLASKIAMMRDLRHATAGGVVAEGTTELSAT